MEGLLVILILAVAGALLYNAKSRNDKTSPAAASENNNNEQINNEQMSNEMLTPETIREETRNLMVNTLSNLGCQPKVSEDQLVDVTYQGENFRMEVGGRFVNIWDPSWSVIKADDPELPRIRDAVNASNFSFGPTVVMTAPDENGNIFVHSRYGILLLPEIPDIEAYVKSSLSLFFEAKQEVAQHLQNFRIEQQQKQSNRRPIGFQNNPA